MNNDDDAQQKDYVARLESMLVDRDLLIEELTSKYLDAMMLTLRLNDFLSTSALLCPNILWKMYIAALIKMSIQAGEDSRFKNRMNEEIASKAFAERIRKEIGL